jgi:SAM-dependent methyltransferase
MGDYDFGYSLWWTHGHLIPFALAAGALTLSVWRGWPRWLALGAGAIAIWALTGFAIVQLVLGANRPLDLPTTAFFPSGSGDVLDVGAGSGRSTVMVLRDRPDARVTALDIYQGYFGIDDNTPDRLRANARAAGALERVSVVTGDMRAMPLPHARFDAAVSAAAIDHLGRDDIATALREVSRVLKDDGQFLLMVINVDVWVRLAYPMAHHGYFGHSPNAETWRERLELAGFEVIEQGTRPATLYFLTRKAASVDRDAGGI